MLPNDMEIKEHIKYDPIMRKMRKESRHFDSAFRISSPDLGQLCPE